MTRCSELALVLGTLLLAGPAQAETLVSDAFGLYDPATSAPERRDWAGWIDGPSATAVAPQEADRLGIFAGPKSLVAGKDPGHVVAIVVDRFGNLVADGTPASVTVSGAPTASVTTGGIADLLIQPRTKAEDLFVGVTAGRRQSPQAMLGIVADIASIGPVLSGPLPDVASDTAFETRSAPLADQYGNPVPQGTGASVLLRHADGSYSLGQGGALQDRALVRFIARDISGPVSATMTLGGQSSNSARFLVRTPSPAGLPALELERLPEIGALRLSLGPFLTRDGYALADGAEVTVTADLADGFQVSEHAWVQDGEISILLPIGDPSAVTRLSLLSPLGPMVLPPGWQSGGALPPATREPQP
jgi:hypothetical protein